MGLLGHDDPPEDKPECAYIPCDESAIAGTPWCFEHRVTQPPAPSSGEGVLRRDIEDCVANIDAPTAEIRVSLPGGESYITTQLAEAVDDIVNAAMNWSTQQVEAAVKKSKIHHASDLARAVGLLEGLKYPDKYLTKRLNKVQAELEAIALQKEKQ